MKDEAIHHCRFAANEAPYRVNASANRNFTTPIHLLTLPDEEKPFPIGLMVPPVGLMLWPNGSLLRRFVLCFSQSIFMPNKSVKGSYQPA